MFQKVESESCRWICQVLSWHLRQSLHQCDVLTVEEVFHPEEVPWPHISKSPSMTIETDSFVVKPQSLPSSRVPVIDMIYHGMVRGLRHIRCMPRIAFERHDGLVHAHKSAMDDLTYSIVIIVIILSHRTVD